MTKDKRKSIDEWKKRKISPLEGKLVVAGALFGIASSGILQALDYCKSNDYIIKEENPLTYTMTMAVSSLAFGLIG